MVKKKKKKSLVKRLNEKIKMKRVVKKSKTTLYLSKKEYPSILNDPNRFFKDEVEDAEMALFFT